MTHSSSSDFFDFISIINQKSPLQQKAIKSLLDHGVVNQKTGFEFDLSNTDIKLLACAIANGYWISSGDRDLKDLGLHKIRLLTNNPKKEGATNEGNHKEKKKSNKRDGSSIGETGNYR